jgi:DnaJ-domain-containing protein 1
MTLVDKVLEMLRAHFPGFEPDGEWARRPRSEPAGEWAQGFRDRPRGHSRDHSRDYSRDHRREQPETDPVLARCYAELGIPYGADFNQVRRTWRRLMREHHPDVQGEDPDRQRASTELAQRLNEAFGEIRRRLSGGDF